MMRAKMMVDESSSASADLFIYDISGGSMWSDVKGEPMIILNPCIYDYKQWVREIRTHCV